jgi:hypothetical protein
MTATRARPTISPRLPFYNRYINTFNSQAIHTPGWLLTDNYGAFEVRQDATNTSNKVLFQAVQTPPVSWHAEDAPPATCLPSGSNAANTVVKVRVFFPDNNVRDLEPATARLCLHVGMFSRQTVTEGVTPSSGLCLVLMANGTAQVVENGGRLGPGSVVLAQATITQSGQWADLELSTLNGLVAASVNGQTLPTVHNTTRRNGVACLATSWHNVAFDDMEVMFVGGFTPNAFFLDSILPTTTATIPANTWFGYVLESFGGFTITHLGLHITPNDTAVYELALLHANLTIIASCSVSWNTCAVDTQGQCYCGVTTPALAPDTVITMAARTDVESVQPLLTQAATMTNMSHRDGESYLNYALERGRVVDRVGGTAHEFEPDTMVGYFNFQYQV